MKKYLSACILFLSAFIPAAGERFHARPAELESIANGTVYAITQDSKGAMWFGTTYGVCRYNGIELQNISQFIPLHPFVTDGNDVFYCYGENSILKVDARTCRTTRIRCGNIESPLNSVAVKDSKLIACDNYSLYTGQGDSLVQWLRVPKEYGRSKFLRSTPSGRLFLTTSEGKLLELIDSRLFLRAELSDPVCEIYEDRNYKLWIGLESKGISVFSHDFLKRTDFHPQDHRKTARRFRSFIEDFEGNVFAGGLDGLYSISPDGECKSETSYTPDGYPISTMFRDMSDNIWVGTYYGGAFLCEKNVSPFLKVEGSLSSQPCISTGLMEDKHGDMWLVTDRSGMYRFPKDGSPARFIPGSAEFKMKNAWYDKDNDAIWISNYLQPFSRYDIPTGRWTRYDYTSNDGKKRIVSGFRIAKVGDDLWIAGSGVIYLFNPMTERSIKRTLPNFKGRLLNLCTVSDGSVLMCGNGLFRWKDGKVRKLSDFDGASCFDAVQDQDAIWVGTNSGVYQCDTSGNVLSHFDKRNVGLEDNFVYAIMVLQGGRLLLGTNGGVSILNTNDAECFNYSTRNGLTLSSVQEGCITQRTDGSVWIAGTDGIARFDPSDHRIPQSYPRITIDKITASGCEKVIKEGRPLNLSHKENNISIQLANFDFAGIVPAFVQCRLLPYEKDWKDIDIKTPISYLGLKSGNYMFEVRSLSSPLNREPSGSTGLEFRVCHPWYWSPVAWIIYLLLLGVYVRFQVIMISEYRARQRIRNAKDVSIVAQNDSDTEFIRKTEKVISSHLSDSSFSVESLCQETGMNYQNFSSRIKSLTGYSPRSFIEVIRMRKASELLLDKDMNISDVAFEVGFNSSQYFATRFKKHFGLTPSEYISQTEK